MKLDNKEKQLLKVLLSAILFYFIILRIDTVMSFAKGTVSLLKPFIYGAALAFVINVPMIKVESALQSHGVKKGTRGIAFLLTIVMFICVVAAFLTIVVPQLARTVTTLIDHLQYFVDTTIPALLESHGENLTFIEEYIVSLNINWQQMGHQLIDWLKNFAVSLLDNGSSVVVGFVSGFTTALFALIFSIYILFGKEKISHALKKLCLAVMGEKHSGKIFHVCSLTYRIFTSFISGQCFEAVILGTMFVVTMKILRLPYAFLIGVIIAVTALIPVFGAFIGCAVGIVLIALESPVQAVWFVVLFLILQQVEGNFIYPHVVGGSVGLPSILVFMSVILGSELMGVAGMLIFIPGVSVIYALVKEFVCARLPQETAQIEEKTTERNSRSEKR